MSHPGKFIDGTALYELLKSETSGSAEIYRHAYATLKKYLMVTMKAHASDAEECVAQVFLNTIEQIRKDAIQEPASLYSYLLLSCRRAYVRMVKQDQLVSEQDPDYIVTPSNQFTLLAVKERQTALQRCLDELNDDYRSFIQFWFDEPDIDAKTIASQLNTTTGNVWTKKSRVIKLLSECVKLKMN